MSTSEPVRTDFDRWLRGEFAGRGEFTALVVLVAITETKVSPLCSTYFNVIGAEVDWPEITMLLAGSGQAWQGAAFFPEVAADGGALDNPTARLRLRLLEERLGQDRLVLNEGHFFDQWGRRLQVEEV
ncbi:hypothetical protein [Phreatobacter sp. AB_2022a]|uniref:hypothetical protein n=1 Tax=Phreatobacter sp. AB_2022a TaxID=3003134 RepID=UPI0022871EC1|nr:hypothetical protein [Phreatobacter sp. AB_2022a]MCZ0735474.1 hypothetical protein [Phreatobacter sp. AB_2022a]